MRPGDSPAATPSNSPSSTRCLPVGVSCAFNNWCDSRSESQIEKESNLFSGIIETTATVRRIGPSPNARDTGALRLELDAGEFLADSPLGASIAVNGVCLTLASRAAQVAGFDVVPETMRLTNLSKARIGDRVNLERSLRVGDRIDGHFVQGHVDGVGKVIRNGSEAGGWKMWIQIPLELKPFFVHKGSISLDGVSLTLVNVDADRISVALIPTTLERTVLGARRAGDLINIETDVLARLVVARLGDLNLASVPNSGNDKSAITFEQLRQAGFAP